MLIDFNRSIDLKLFDNGTAFVTCVPKKELACVEMLNNRPWIFQVTSSIFRRKKTVTPLF